jgi:hypothetical protein
MVLPVGFAVCADAGAGSLSFSTFMREATGFMSLKKSMYQSISAAAIAKRPPAAGLSIADSGMPLLICKTTAAGAVIPARHARAVIARALPESRILETALARICA